MERQDRLNMMNTLFYYTKKEQAAQHINKMNQKVEITLNKKQKA